MQNQSTNLFIFLNSVLTAPHGDLVYEKEDDSFLPENQKLFFEIPLPKGVNEDDVRWILFTTWEKAIPEDGEYFKQINPKTQKFIFRPFLENNSLKFNLGNNGFTIEEKLKKACISKIQEEFKMIEEEAFKKIFEAEKNEHRATFSPNWILSSPEKLLKIFSEFETKYIVQNLVELRAHTKLNSFFENFIDSLLNEDRIKEDVLVCVQSYFAENTVFKNNNHLKFKKNGKSETLKFSIWAPVFASQLSKILTSDYWDLIKVYLKDITSFKPIDDTIATPIANSFKTELERHYNVKPGSLKIGDFLVNDEYAKTDTRNILYVLKVQYLYFHRVLIKVHRISRSTKTAFEAINNFSGIDIDKFKQSLYNYQAAFGNEETLSQSIEDLKTKLDEVVTEDIKIYTQFKLFDALKTEKRVLHFTLILKNSQYAYPGFYTFRENVLEPLKDKAEVEVYEIIKVWRTEEHRDKLDQKEPRK